MTELYEVTQELNAIQASEGEDCFMRDREISELLKQSFWPENESKVCTAAMLLALSSTIFGEESIKALLKEEGLQFVVTEIGGKLQGEFQERLTRAIIGACLNSNLIQKVSYQIHAVLHATEEAKHGILVNMTTSLSLALKIAVVRDEHWIAVALYGQSAIHPLTNHQRCGLGVMHL